MIRITIITLLLNILLNATSNGCWDIKERADLEFSELDSAGTSTRFSFKDANTCAPIAYAKVTFTGQSFMTDPYGEITIPLPPEDIDFKFPLNAKKAGYIMLNQKVTTKLGSFWQNKFLMTKDMSKRSAKFILSWGRKPSDLDLHIVSDDFHISYRKKIGNLNKVILHRDAKNGYGPETITIKDLDISKVYRVLIHKYSNNGNIDHNTHLSVYKNNMMHNNLSVGRTISAKCIQVAKIINNEILYNTIVLDENECKN